MTQQNAQELAMFFSKPFGELLRAYGKECDPVIGLIQAAGRSALFPLVFPTPVHVYDGAAGESVSVFQISQNEHPSVYDAFLKTGIASGYTLEALKSINDKVFNAEKAALVKPEWNDTGKTYALKFDAEKTPEKVRASLIDAEISIVESIFSAVVDHIQNPENGIDPKMGQDLKVVQNHAKDVLDKARKFDEMLQPPLLVAPRRPSPLDR